VYIDGILEAADSYVSTKSRIKMSNSLAGSPFDYLLYFLPVDHFRTIVDNINTYARSVINSWTNVTYPEYMIWIALLTAITVIKHYDRKAYWYLGSSHFHISINFTNYMPMQRFNNIMRMHVFEVPSKEKQVNDSLYQIKSTLNESNDHIKDYLIPGKHLVIDETMNQWLKVGMPNLKEVSRKPHPIGQEFKSLADYYTNAIIRLGTVNDPRLKRYYKEPGMLNLLVIVKRLVKPWFNSGRTITADSCLVHSKWFQC
jgi:hypothetical protein